MHPWPTRRGTASLPKSLETRQSWGTRGKVLTAVETTADTHHDNLNSQQTAETEENRARLVVDGVNTDDMYDGASCQEDCGANRFKEEEVLTLLKRSEESG